MHWYIGSIAIICLPYCTKCCLLYTNISSKSRPLSINYQSFEFGQNLKNVYILNCGLFDCLRWSRVFFFTASLSAADANIWNVEYSAQKWLSGHHKDTTALCLQHPRSLGHILNRLHACHHFLAIVHHSLCAHHSQGNKPISITGTLSFWGFPLWILDDGMIDSLSFTLHRG